LAKQRRNNAVRQWTTRLAWAVALVALALCPISAGAQERTKAPAPAKAGEPAKRTEPAKEGNDIRPAEAAEKAKAGADKRRLRPQTLITPACGCGTLTIAQAEKIYRIAESLEKGYLA